MVWQILFLSLAVNVENSSWWGWFSGNKMKEIECVRGRKRAVFIGQWVAMRNFKTSPQFPSRSHMSFNALWCPQPPVHLCYLTINPQCFLFSVICLREFLDSVLILPQSTFPRLFSRHWWRSCNLCQLEL